MMMTRRKRRDTHFQETGGKTTNWIGNAVAERRRRREEGETTLKIRETKLSDPRARSHKKKIDWWGGMEEEEGKVVVVVRRWCGAVPRERGRGRLV